MRKIFFKVGMYSHRKDKNYRSCNPFIVTWKADQLQKGTNNFPVPVVIIPPNCKTKIILFRFYCDQFIICLGGNGCISS